MDLSTLNNPRIASDIREFLEMNPSQSPPTSAVEAFDMYLTWHGIQGFSGMIREALFDLITTEHIADMDLEQSHQLAKLLGVM